MTATRTCGNCAIADCEFAGLMPDCPKWTNTDDSITAADIAADLAPLSREECARRGIRHSSEDNSKWRKAKVYRQDSVTLAAFAGRLMPMRSAAE